MTPTPTQAIAAGILALALIHTFATRFFERLANAIRGTRGSSTSSARWKWYSGSGA